MSTAVTQDKVLEFEVPNKISLIDEAVSKTVRFASDCGFVEEALFGIDMAVREAVANAIRHGNGPDGDAPVEVSLSCSAHGLEISVRDHGAGFAPEDVPDPTNPENLLKPTGRGLLFMRNFMDSAEWVQHRAGGTLVRMIKKR